MKTVIPAFVLAVTLGVAAYNNVSADSADHGSGWSKKCESWVGHDINDLIRSWGAPDKDYRMPDGDVIYEWHDSASFADPVEVYPDGAGGFTTDGGGTMTFVCNTSFTTTPDGIIYDWKWNGNHCIAAPTPAAPPPQETPEERAAKWRAIEAQPLPTTPTFINDGSGTPAVIYDGTHAATQRPLNKKPHCVYKAVMSDTDIALCRAESGGQ